MYLQLAGRHSVRKKNGKKKLQQMGPMRLRNERKTAIKGELHRNTSAQNTCWKKKKKPLHD